MTIIKSILAASLLIGTLAACDTMNGVHESLQINDSTKDVQFEGVNGDAQSYCSPAKRAQRVCY